MDVETRPHPAVTSLEACPSTLARLIEELETHESLEDRFERVWRHGALCDVVWRHVMLCDIVWCCVTLCDVVLHCVMLCDVIWCSVTLCDVVWCDVVWRRVTPCDETLGRKLASDDSSKTDLDRREIFADIFASHRWWGIPSIVFNGPVQWCTCKLACVISTWIFIIFLPLVNLKIYRRASHKQYL